MIVDVWSTCIRDITLDLMTVNNLPAGSQFEQKMMKRVQDCTSGEGLKSTLRNKTAISDPAAELSAMCAMQSSGEENDEPRIVSVFCEKDCFGHLALTDTRGLRPRKVSVTAHVCNVLFPSFPNCAKDCVLLLHSVLLGYNYFPACLCCKA